MYEFLPIQADPDFDEFRKFLQAELERTVKELNIPANVLAEESSNYNYESARQDAMWWNSFPWN